MKQSAILW